MLLVGFGYKARQGKNTSALAFMDQCPIGADVRLVSFASALKAEVTKMGRQCGGFHELAEMLRTVYGAPPTVTAEFEGKQRPILQWWGTDYRRAKDPDYWVHRFFEGLDATKPDVAICTDVRFPNEADAIRRRGGYTVKVTRTTAPDIAVADHWSEHALDDYEAWDYELQAATVPELKAKAKALYGEIERRR